MGGGGGKSPAHVYTVYSLWWGCGSEPGESPWNTLLGKQIQFVLVPVPVLAQVCRTPCEAPFRICQSTLSYFQRSSPAPELPVPYLVQQRAAIGYRGQKQHLLTLTAPKLEEKVQDKS